MNALTHGPAGCREETDFPFDVVPESGSVATCKPPQSYTVEGNDIIEGMIELRDFALSDLSCSEWKARYDETRAIECARLESERLANRDTSDVPPLTERAAEAAGWVCDLFGSSASKLGRRELVIEPRTGFIVFVDARPRTLDRDVEVAAVKLRAGMDGFPVLASVRCTHHESQPPYAVALAFDATEGDFERVGRSVSTALGQEPRESGNVATRASSARLRRSRPGPNRLRKSPRRRGYF